ncbi:MAG: hypothetical protein JW734_06505 [Candidatus Omnitrophica bacterium]|nr:hypothetical protein [Candidatus Omnitrophota bacterium]
MFREATIDRQTPEHDKKNRTYKVIDLTTNQEIEGTFVLIPEYDSAARSALAAYAEATNKPRIARWLRAWLHEIHRKRAQRKNNGDAGLEFGNKYND